MALVIRTPQEMLQWRKSVQAQSVGFVPTMGALHHGHETLLQKARGENELLVLSIYVNPTQFNDKTDFEKYPITWDADVALAEKNQVDVIFAPTYPVMYPDGYTYKVIETEFSQELCGKDRPGHFDGVLTVVMKLLNAVQPERAYFGEKDFQQLNLIQGMVQAFFLNCEIVPVPTVREADGLAMSSRNVRLTPEQREQAPLIYRILKSAPSAEAAQVELENQKWKVDYVVETRGRRLAAVRVGEVRLIDNVQI
jgi:pantoate--beta-alanine ligase